MYYFISQFFPAFPRIKLHEIALFYEAICSHFYNKIKYKRKKMEGRKNHF